jgi:hypothetical protein
MDQKATNGGTLKAYRAWQRYVLKAKPKLTKGCTKPTLKLYCLAMAFHGRNGIGCYASDAAIADEMCMYDASAVSGLVCPARFRWQGQPRRGRAHDRGQ